MRKPRLLDLGCRAGGTSMGYSQAGFEVAGCDIHPQPKFPFEFILGDMFDVLERYGHLFDAFGASPPCQEYTKATKQWRKDGRQYPDLIARLRDVLKKTGKPYIIENVPGSPLIDPVMLNGSMFGLLVHRPRLFECSFPIEQPFIPTTKKPVKMGRPVKEGDIIQPVGHFSGVAYAQRQMGIDWMGQKDLSQAIPPAYTKWLGERMIETCFSCDDNLINEIQPKQSLDSIVIVVGVTGLPLLDGKILDLVLLYGKDKEFFPELNWRCLDGENLT